MSWKVFIIPKLGKSVLNTDPNLSLDKGTLKFTYNTGGLVIPELTLDGGGTFPRVALGEDDEKNSYTLKIFVDDPGANPTPRFLGQLVKANSTGILEGYDTILALPSEEVLPNTVSDYTGDITLTAPKGLLIDIDVLGNISKTNNQFKFTPKDQPQATVSLTFDSTYPTNFFSNGFHLGPKLHNMGGRYVNRLKSLEHVIFGHIQWGSDISGPGDKTEPFVVIQPPPPIPYGGDGS